MEILRIPEEDDVFTRNTIFVQFYNRLSPCDDSGNHVNDRYADQK